MKLRVHIERLQLRDTFTTSRASSDVSEVVLVELEDEGILGRGEARPTSFYEQTPAGEAEALTRLAPRLESRDLGAYRDFLGYAAQELGPHRGALCALDLAVHDWVGKKLGLPLHSLLGLSAQDLPLTSFTVGIDSLDRMVEKLQAACRHPIIKIKLGTDDDVEIVRTLRRETEAVLRVDANCGWDAKKTIAMSHELHALGVEFIEQPLPAEELDAMEEVYRHSALPLIADENCVVPEDVPELRGRFHGINVKLVKCGGILPALRALELARLLGLKTMLGCMIESSLCITAAAHLGPLADFVDLDGPLLITNDPFRGVEYEGARLRLPQRPGLGVEPRDAEPR